MLDFIGKNNLAQIKPIAFSFGVSDSSPWDLEMAENGYLVYEFDASIDKSPYCHENIKFIKKFIAAHDENDTISLESALKLAQIDIKNHNILQCDIEDCEWEMLENIDVGESLARNFSQIIFEFHNCDPRYSVLCERRIAALEKIKTHFIPIHAHFNNYGNIFFDNGKFWCDVLEVSYLRRDLATGARKKWGCINSSLDFPNCSIFADIPVIF